MLNSDKGKTLSFKSSSSKAIVNNQFVELEPLVTIDKGTWLIQIITNFAKNNIGSRIVWLKSNHNYDSNISCTEKALDNSTTDVNTVGIYECVENNVALTIQVYQDCGASLALNKYHLVAVKLR